MPKRHLLSTFGLALFALLFFAAPLSAQTVTGLQIDFDTLDDDAVEALQGELADAFRRSRYYDWLPPQQGVDTLDDDLYGCFDADCLIDIGIELNARLGLHIEFEVESHIYDWYIDLYDLGTGQLMATELGACDFCGRAELLEHFRASISLLLATIDIDDDGSRPIDTRLADGDQSGTELRIETVPDDTRIFLDDEPVGQGSVAVLLGIGVYEVRFSHDDFPGSTEVLHITEDSAPLVMLRVNLRESAGQVAPEVVSLRSEPPFGRATTPLGISSTFLGLSLTSASIYFAQRHGQPACADDIPARHCPEVYNTAGLSSGMAIVGTTALVSGLYLLIRGRSSGDAPQEEVMEPTEIDEDPDGEPAAEQSEPTGEDTQDSPPE